MSDETKAVIVKVNGRKAWLIDGMILPYIAGGTGDGDGNGDGDGGGDGDGDNKIEFTEAQQAHIDKLIGSKFADAHTKAEAKAQIEIDALKLERDEALKAKKPDEKQNKGNEDLTALKEKISVLEADKTKGFQTACESNIISAASELKAIKPKQVFDLIKSQVDVAPDGKRTVVNSEGQPRINAGGQPMSEMELVSEYLADNQHLVQASGKTGSGSQQPGFGESNDEDLAKLPLVEQLTAVRAANAAKNK